MRLDKAEDDGIEFRLAARELDSRARYEIGVLVDLAGDGQRSVGDFINTRAYSVLTREFPDEAEVHVHPIGRRASKGIRGPLEAPSCL